MIEQNTLIKQQEKPRLTPIKNPENLKTKLAYWFGRYKMGTVITPLKVMNGPMNIGSDELCALWSNGK